MYFRKIRFQKDHKLSSPIAVRACFVHSCKTLFNITDEFSEDYESESMYENGAMSYLIYYMDEIMYQAV